MRELKKSDLLNEIAIEKSKYVKREGTPGHYKYYYRNADGSISVRGNKESGKSSASTDGIKNEIDDMKKNGYTNKQIAAWCEHGLKNYESQLEKLSDPEKIKDCKNNIAGLKNAIANLNENTETPKAAGKMPSGYVASLSAETKTKLKAAIQDHFKENGISGDDLNEAVENAMDSKVSDLEEIYNSNSKVKNILMNSGTEKTITKSIETGRNSFRTF